MIKVCCRHLSLSELSLDIDITTYQDFVRPLDYDFALERGVEYIAIGITERKGTPWLYVVPADGDVELDIVPAALFSFDEAVIPPGMVVRMTTGPHFGLEILPRSLAIIEDWFERYVEGDEDVVATVESIARPTSRA